MLRLVIGLALSLLVSAAMAQEKTGARGQESGVRKEGTGDKGQVTGDRGQETGDRGQVTGDRGQETTATTPSVKNTPPPKVVVSTTSTAADEPKKKHPAHAAIDYFGLLFVFVLATFIGLGVVARVSRLLHTPLMSLTNAISAIAVVGSIIVTGADYPLPIRIMGAIALFASMTNVVSGFLITDRMLKMFKQTRTEGKQ